MKTEDRAEFDLNHRLEKGVICHSFRVRVRGRTKAQVVVIHLSYIRRLMWRLSMVISDDDGAAVYILRGRQTDT